MGNYQKKIFGMNPENSQPAELIRIEDLIEELGIKKDTYYRDCNYLGIEAQKDSEGKAYLTKEQADQIRSLRSYVEKNGKRNGFENSSIVKASVSNLEQSTENIYVEPEDPIDNFDIDKLIRKAAQLKARELATPDLAIRAIADRMSEDDLPEDLKQKVEAVREAVNPKWTPAELADRILTQYRSNRNGS
jgi:hypothetical protein